MHFNDYLDNYSKPNQNDNTFEHNDVNSYHDLIYKEDKVLNTIKTIITLRNLKTQIKHYLPFIRFY